MLSCRPGSVPLPAVDLSYTSSGYEHIIGSTKSLEIVLEADKSSVCVWAHSVCVSFCAPFGLAVLAEGRAAIPAPRLQVWEGEAAKALPSAAPRL